MKIQLVLGDITRIEVDGIVNAANASLAGGGGVDGAIHRAGGKKIMEELDMIRKKTGGCPTGEAVITTAGELPARHVIHTVGPVWAGGSKGEPGKLASAYRNSLRLAEEYGLKSVSFPNISTGVYGYPKNEAARIALDTIQDYASGGTGIGRVVFVCYDEESYHVYERLMQERGIVS